MLGLSGSGCRVVLIGTGSYASARIPGIPAAVNTLMDVRQALIDRCGVAEENVRVVVDPAQPADLGNALADAAEEAEGVLLVYYVGHGMVSPGGALYLTTRITDPDPRRLAHTALAYAAVRDCLLNSPARSLIVVLDCCFSGRAIGALGDPAGEAAGLAHIQGGLVLAAAAREEVALVAPGGRRTAFSGELLRLLRDGDPQGPQEFTLRSVYQHLCRVLPAQGFPRPQRQSSAGIDDLVLAVNPAYRQAGPGGDAGAASALVGVSADPGDRGGDVCPYPGLAPFGLGEAAWFFGRERLTAELVGRVAESFGGTGPLLVTGPSGSGKSSLLRAGLLPALGDGALPMPGARSWPVLLFTPTAYPVRELAARISAISGTSAEAVLGELAADPAAFARLVRGALARMTSTGAAAGSRAVLVIDQFEEIFTLCSDDADRRVFVAALCAAARADEGPGGEPAALVVLGMRADFYGHCPAFPDLVPALQDSQILVGPMTVPELRAAITRPAETTGLQLEPGLVELLLRDAGVAGSVPRDGEAAAHDEGTLPLLAHALRATWQQRDHRTLTVAGYQITGGISEAVATTAERMYQRLDASAREVARLVLLRLVRVGEGADDSRRRVERIQLLAESPDPEAAASILRAFADARLITLDADTVEITHEALLRHWPRLRNWIGTDRAGLLLHQRLTEAARTWHKDSRDVAALYRGTRLTAVRDWLQAGHQEELSALDREFLDASTQQEQAEQRAARRRTRRVYQVLAALTVLVLVSTALTGYAFDLRSAASQQRDLAVSRQVAIEADQVRGNDVSLFMQLSLEAYRIAPTIEARARLLDSSALVPATRLLGASGVLQSVAFSPDHRTLAASGSDNKVRLWDVARPAHAAPLGPPLAGFTSTVFSLAFSPDGRTLAAGSGDQTVRLWDVADPAHPRQLGAPLAGFTNTVFSLAFSPDGRTLAAGSADGTVRLWDMASPARSRIVATLTGPAGYVQSVAFSPDGRMLAAASADKTVRLWDVAHPASPAPLGGPLTGFTGTVYSVAFSPDGRMLAAGSLDKTVRIWNVTRPTRPRLLGAPLTGPASWVNCVLFSPDGHTLAASSSDDKVWLWDLPTRHVLSTLVHPAPVTTLAFTPDSHTLASGAADGTVRLWALPGPILTGPAKGVNEVTFSPDGHILAASSSDGRVWLWDATRPGQPRALGTLAGPSSWLNAVAFSPDGHIVAAGGNDHKVWLWNVVKPTQPRILQALTGPASLVEAVAFSPDGRTLAAGSDDGKVWRWDVTDRSRPRALTALTGFAKNAYVYSVAFNPSGRILAAGSTDETVRLWDVANPAHPVPLGTPLTGPTSYVQSVDFSPDGRTLAVGSADETLRLWDVTRPARPLALGPPLTGPNGYVYSVMFSPAGRILATGNTDDTVWLWDVTDRRHPRHLATLTGPTAYVYSVAFSKNGRTLAVGGADTTVRLFDTNPDRVADYICSTAGTPLTQTEWRNYIPDLPYNPPCRRQH